MALALRASTAAALDSGVPAVNVAEVYSAAARPRTSGPSRPLSAISKPSADSAPPAAMQVLWAPARSPIASLASTSAAAVASACGPVVPFDADEMRAPAVCADSTLSTAASSAAPPAPLLSPATPMSPLRRAYVPRKRQSDAWSCCSRCAASSWPTAANLSLQLPPRAGPTAAACSRNSQSGSTPPSLRNGPRGYMSTDPMPQSEMVPEPAPATTMRPFDPNATAGHGGRPAGHRSASSRVRGGGGSCLGCCCC
mmetsp:Transcript_15382/g.63881  ORF Transcript_15382/g.63881 Transcript_15382/m.63881 type:complete len:254 (+) Transcript_15382:1719-2480(+)